MWPAISLTFLVSFTTPCECVRWKGKPFVLLTTSGRLPVCSLVLPIQKPGEPDVFAGRNCSELKFGWSLSAKTCIKQMPDWSTSWASSSRMQHQIHSSLVNCYFCLLWHCSMALLLSPHVAADLRLYSGHNSRFSDLIVVELSSFATFLSPLFPAVITLVHSSTMRSPQRGKVSYWSFIC